MDDPEPTLLTDDDAGVRTIRLNRPDVLNAFNDDMLASLAKAVRAAEKDSTVRCVVITGSGRAFSSGQDLADVKARYDSPEPIELGQHLRDTYNPIINKLRTMEKPVIAAVNGVAAGAGCSLALACDMRLAAEFASFIQAFIHVGVIPDSGSTFMLPRLVGMARAMELAFTGRRVKAEEAVRIGLANRMVADDALHDETMTLARKLATLPTKTIGLTKRAIGAAWNNDLPAQLDYEAQLQTTAGKTHDHREGVAAFLEKRAARFEGR